MARIVSFLVLIAILVITSIIFFQVMAGFFVPLFLAALLGVVVQPVYQWILARCRGYSYLAAGITTAIVAVMILMPIGLVVTTATLEGLSLIDELQLADVRLKLDELRRDFHLQIPFEQDVRHIEATLHAWRERQRSGEPIVIQAAQVHNLQVRLSHINDELKKQPENVTLLTDAQELEDQLKAIAEAEPDSVERDVALQHADAAFRKFKRELLGGTYRAWLT